MEAVLIRQFQFSRIQSMTNIFLFIGILAVRAPQWST